MSKPYLALGLFALLAFGPAAHAVEAGRYDFQGAVGMCKGALQSHRDALRAKPLGLTNIASADAFVTCTWQGDATPNGRGASQVFVLVSNTSTGGRTVTCTLINGTQAGATTTATYTPKTVGLSPGTNTFLAWVPSELPSAPAEITQPAVTCLLPAGTTLHYTGRNYLEDVGG